MEPGQPRTTVIDSVEQGYANVLEEIYRHGTMPAPRGKFTFEIQGYTIISRDPTKNRLVSGETETFLESEIRTIRAGEPPEQKADQELIDRLDLESDGTFFESGVRDAISRQWDGWVERFLHEDAGTRKCATVFTNPVDPNPPCTLFLQFMVRKNMLHMYTLNRSQDMLFAYPMDMGLFQTLQCDMASTLAEYGNISLGYHWHTMISAHIYEDQWEEASQVWES